MSTEYRWSKPKNITECNKSIVDNDNKIKELKKQIKQKELEIERLNDEIYMLSEYIVKADDLKQQYIKEEKEKKKVR